MIDKFLHRSAARFSGFAALYGRFLFGTLVSYEIIFTKKQRNCNANVNFSTHHTRVLIISIGVRRATRYHRRYQMKSGFFYLARKPRCFLFWIVFRVFGHRSSVPGEDYTGRSVSDSFFTSRMTTIYIVTTNARNRIVENTSPIIAQAS